MTDERIEELATELGKCVKRQILFPSFSNELEPHEVEDVASEVERALVKALYLIEFKKMRAKGWKP